ncbi:MAG: 16S rRNA (guanine(966)-N(2))-methyltransferase RsmD [bacterium]|nr:16S rRNA (guanine(966)-N(2))-methyltransferase RsmD [bacterium]
MAIRVIGGECKGFMLKGPPGEGTRPILARVRKSMFDILTPYLKDSVFLDLFCGTGAVGIEALSRGAQSLVSVELDKRVCDCIRWNLNYCKMIDESEVICTDVFEFLRAFDRQKFDIVFAGPPYPAYFCEGILDALDHCHFLKDNTVILLQHHIKEILPEETKKLRKYRDKKYGDTILSFYKIV